MLRPSPALPGHRDSGRHSLRSARARSVSTPVASAVRDFLRCGRVVRTAIRGRSSATTEVLVWHAAPPLTEYVPESSILRCLAQLAARGFITRTVCVHRFVPTEFVSCHGWNAAVPISGPRAMTSSIPLTLEAQ